MKRRISVFISVILLFGILTGCSANSKVYNGSAPQTVDRVTSSNTKFDMAVSGESYGGAGESFDDGYFYPDKSEDQAVGNVLDGYVEAKKVYTANVDMQTKDIDSAINAIYERIQSTGSYVENESRQNWNSYEGYSHNRFLNMTIRVPSKEFNTFLNEIEGENLIVTALSRDVQDYSTMYYDKDSRVKSLRIQEERLLTLLSQAENVTVMLEIEKSLTDVRYEIESLTKELKVIDSKVEYSTVNLYLYEVTRYSPTATPKTFSERISVALQQAIEDFQEDFEDFIVNLAYNWPYVLMNAAILIVILLFLKFIVKKIFKKGSKKKKKTEKAPAEKPVEKVNFIEADKGDDNDLL